MQTTMEEGSGIEEGENDPEFGGVQEPTGSYQLHTHVDVMYQPVRSAAHRGYVLRSTYCIMYTLYTVQPRSRMLMSLP